MTSIASDLRAAVRLLRRAPAFTLLCALTLGVGIGATTAIFSVVNTLLLESLPYPDASQLVAIWERDGSGSRSNMGFATYADLRGAHSLASSAMTGDWQPVLADGDTPDRVSGARVSWTYFRTLGVAPAIGRWFLEDEDQPERNPVVVLSHGLWARRYRSDSGTVGRTINVDGTMMTVVGVMPRSYKDLVSPEAQIWRVLGYTATQSWGWAVSIILLIAMANVSNLQLDAQSGDAASSRCVSHWVADRFRLARQLLAEGLVLATLVGILGFAHRVGAVPAMVSRLPADLSRLAGIGRWDRAADARPRTGGNSFRRKAAHKLV